MKRFMWLMGGTTALLLASGLTTSDPITFVSPRNVTSVGPGYLYITTDLTANRRAMLKLSGRGVFVEEQELVGGVWKAVEQSSLTARNGAVVGFMGGEPDRADGIRQAQ